MSDQPNSEQFTPEEYQQLAESPADSAIVLEGDAAEDAPEGVIDESDG